ncbi:hypothetical protein ACK8HX_17180 [Oryzobacter sp. R7]|uniref:hypothetical protein n=1 Tax=Oryzobacter faecalis TaxID=3388656 RepID=UPI00398D3F90
MNGWAPRALVLWWSVRRALLALAGLVVVGALAWLVRSLTGSWRGTAGLWDLVAIASSAAPVLLGMAVVVGVVEGVALRRAGHVVVAALLTGALGAGLGAAATAGWEYDATLVALGAAVLATLCGAVCALGTLRDSRRLHAARLGAVV